MCGSRKRALTVAQAEIQRFAHYPEERYKTVKKIKKAIQAGIPRGIDKLKGNGRSVPPLKAIKHRFMTEILTVPMTRLMITAIISTQTARQHPELSIETDSRFSIETRFTAAATAERRITFLCVYNYKNGMSKGIACNLNHLQKFADGESLGGKSSAEEDFADIDDEDDDIDEDFLWS